MKQGERGSFTIEAILTLPVFMAAFITIASLAMVARAESRTQYAIDQVAKEISRYCYVADRANLLLRPSDGSQKKVDSVDEAVGAMMDFANNISNIGASVSDSDGNVGQRIEALVNSTSSEDFQTITTSAKKVYDSLGPLTDDPKGAITALAQVAASKGASKIVSRIIAQPLCKKLVQPYLSNGGDVDEELKRIGIESGLDGLDFSMSTFLMDGRTINVVVIYTIKVNGLGFFDQDIVVKQTASTAAWLSGGTKLSELPEVSYWEQSSADRGKAFTDELKKDNPHKGVKGGVGVDLYDQSTNTFTAVHSINVFSASYSQFNSNAEGSGADKYELKENAIKSKVKSYANDLKNAVKKIGENVEMEDGTECMTGQSDTIIRNHELIIVVPDETRKSQDALDAMNDIATEIEQETGVKVTITYRDKAL